MNRYSILILLAILSGCAGGKHKKPRIAHLQPAEYSHLAGWNQDNHLEALEAFKFSCRAVMRYSPNRKISTLTDLGGKVEDWLPACREATSNGIFTNAQAQQFFEKWFTPYKISDIEQSPKGKFTGYFELELHGSRKRTHIYKHPVYKRPPNLHSIKGSHHISHTSINNGVLANKGLEIAWVADRARLFFMQIQGSGVIKLKEGGELKLGYDGQNGFGYTHIGPLFKKYTQDRIRSPMDMMEWLHRNPKVGQKIMEHNQSYVFFKELNGDGPIGGQGVPLMAERSMAVDHGLYPYSSPMWLQTTTPKTTRHSPYSYNRLLIAQDTGGAIKGAIRGDVFYGRGVHAEEKASFMNNHGSCFVLFPKTVTVPAKYKAR